jgi:hypothetical protein
MDSESTSTMGGRSRRHKRSGKRRGNSSLKSWVTFVKKVQKEEGLSYRNAMMRAKVRKDKGEKWRGGGGQAGEPSMSHTTLGSSPIVGGQASAPAPTGAPTGAPAGAPAARLAAPTMKVSKGGSRKRSRTRGRSRSIGRN